MKEYKRKVFSITIPPVKGAYFGSDLTVYFRPYKRRKQVKCYLYGQLRGIDSFCGSYTDVELSATATCDDEDTFDIVAGQEIALRKVLGKLTDLIRKKTEAMSLSYIELLDRSIDGISYKHTKFINKNKYKF